MTVAGRPIVALGEWPADSAARVPRFVYAVGDLLFDFSLTLDREWTEEFLSLLPAPGANTSVFGPPVEPAPSSCPG
ncbi:MAG TPA: hypothetical protein VJK49_06770 [Candidatus Limnocylindrales bacterium]|nr:hypothetical protein [Candidatus Limnocylindrales bacterium]HLB80618.1 hypothetical protein [Dongiaceae bacterium]